MRDSTAWLQNIKRECKKWLAELFCDIRSQETVEYAVFVGLVALVAALALPALVEHFASILNSVEQGMPVADPSDCGDLNPRAHGGRSPCANN